MYSMPRDALKKLEDTHGNYETGNYLSHMRVYMARADGRSLGSNLKIMQGKTSKVRIELGIYMLI